MMDNSFGFKSVSSEERKKRIRHVFEIVASRYDLMNDFMSFGIYRLWKRRLLKEVARVLKPGGRYLCLEFSKPWALIRPFYNLYSYLVIPCLGAMVARQPAAYTYLIESIRRFPDQQETKKMMQQAGLQM